MLVNRSFVLVVLISVFAGCPSKGTTEMDSPDGAAGAGGNTPPADAGGEMAKLSPDAAAADPGKPLAEGCAANDECASGFCVDGVCCNTACNDQCSICNPPGNLGYCTGQLTGDDTTSAETCTGAHTCGIAISVLNIPACRLKDLQTCKTNLDCFSLNCVTFYVDHDGDGFGEANKTIQFCEEQGAAPPVGYVSRDGDCCDSDASAFPGQTKYFGGADVCGSWDYNCDGTIQGSVGGITYSTVPVTSCGTNVQGSQCGDQCGDPVPVSCR